MRVLIVDDEKIVLDAVSHILSQAFPDLDLYTARNGKEGLMILEDIRPHIVMTDIRMPGISGIEFIKQARKVDQKVKIVIATAFDQFEYAKEAFKYRIEEYILKPLTKKKLIAIVESIMANIERENLRRDSELENIDKLYKAIDMVENNFFHSLMDASGLDEKGGVFRELLGCPLVEGQVIGLKVQPLNDQLNQRTSEKNHKLYTAYTALRNELKLTLNALVSAPMDDSLYAYVEGQDGPGQGLLDRYLYDLCGQLLDDHGLKFTYQVSQVRPLDMIYLAYLEVKHKLLFGQDVFVSHVDGIRPKFDQDLLISFKDEVINRIDLLDDKWQQDWQTFEFAALSGFSTPDDFDFTLGVVNLTMMHIVAAYDKQVTTLPSLVNQGVVKGLLEASPQDRLSMMQGLIKSMMLHKQSDESAYSQVIKSAVSYLESHYANDVTLEALADDLYVTPQHLSKQFKAETGTTFKYFLTHLRMTHAKSLLEGAQSIKDIAYTVGYNDPNYFVRLFKKVTGFTPGEYRKVVTK